MLIGKITTSEEIDKKHTEFQNIPEIHSEVLLNLCIVQNRLKVVFNEH